MDPANLPATRTHHLYFDATIRLQALDYFRALPPFALVWLSHRILLAFALGQYPVGGHAFAHQVGLDRFGAPFGKLQVIGLASDPIRVPDRDDGLHIDCFELVDKVVEFQLPFW